MNVLFVCTANIVRSFMAEAVLKEKLKKKGRRDIAVSSSALIDMKEKPADPLAVKILEENGIEGDCHISTLLTDEMVVNADLIVVMEESLVFFMAVSQIKEKKQIERFLAMILIVCFIVSLVAVYQIPAGGRVSAPFEGEGGEPNTLGGYLVLMMSIVLGLLLTYGSKKLKIVLGILLLFILLALGATLSRSSWVSLVPMTLALIYFSRKKTMIVVPLVLVIIVASFVIPNNIKQRALFTFTQPVEQGQISIGKTRIDTSTSARLESWKMVLESDFIKHPIFGYGITGYRFLDAQYPRVLAETGLIGLVLFFIFYMPFTEMPGRAMPKRPIRCSRDSYWDIWPGSGQWSCTASAPTPLLLSGSWSRSGF